MMDNILYDVAVNGLIFELVDNSTEDSQNAQMSLYHFVNLGHTAYSFFTKIYKDDIEEMVVAAPSYAEAIQFVTDRYKCRLKPEYRIQVHFIGTDLIPGKGKRTIVERFKPSYD